ncbi:helix-turn-helix domain-containing protein [Lysinibacillus sp. M3]|uniref:Helix-turn-helix domain-containing protein n=1 Tax=Lysinibacillus zambalensis TaxID=3160866 RepID=A0ABV1MZ72_9BACI
MSIVESMQELEGKRIVDENGEFSDARSVLEGIVNDIVTEKAQKVQNQLEGYKRKNSKNYIPPEYGGLNRFIGCFRDSIKDIVPCLSPIECGVLITILVKMKKGKDGLLINGGKPMIQKDIEKHIGKGHTTTSKYLNKFTKLGILEEVENVKDRRKNNYRVNPKYHIMGKFPKLTEENRFVKLYKDKLEEMIDSLSLSELGFIYKALPICHHNTFKLVHNPTARYNPTAKEGSEEASFNVDLELFNREELADYMNIDTKTINNLVSSLSRKGLIKTTTAHRVTSYTLHPHIIHPKGTVENRYIQSICNDFETHRKDALRRSKKA